MQMPNLRWASDRLRQFGHGAPVSPLSQTERGALASFWKRSAGPGTAILCASRMSGAEETDTAEDWPILPIH